MTANLRRRLLFGLVLGIAVITGIVIFAGRSAFMDAIETFNWWLVLPVLGLVLTNYILRFGKWQYYVRLSRIEGLSVRESALIFLAGFSMAMTPGKVGEFLKSYLVRSRTGVPMSRTVPIVFSERLTDGAAMLVLTLIGLSAFHYGWPLAIAMSVVIAGLLIIIQQELRVLRLLERLRDTKLGRGRVDGFIEIYRSTRLLLMPRPLTSMLSLSVFSWFFECISLFLILKGLGISGTWVLLLAATFVFATSAWLGGASLLPGGLGATEASATALLLLTVDDPHMTATVAATATLLLRFATLWFGVLIGIVALFITAHWDEDLETFETSMAKEDGVRSGSPD